ncbi:MAG: hypothetical protein H0T62_08385 [Parachlamydiaceae bacterium]|nr:hypothetical protein [Parachlamydiaceae bacterium]
MNDIYLQLHGDDKDSSHISADKFENAEDKLLDDFIDKFSLLEASQINKLIPESIKKAKIKEDLKSSIKCLDFDINLGPAFEILFKDRHLHIEEDKYEEMVIQLLNIADYIEQIDFSKPIEESFYSLFHISPSTMQSMFQIGIAKYNEEEFESSLSIFYLISSLDQTNADYWYRLGIIAIQIEKLNLALQGFAYAIFYNRDLMGARIFSAQCYLKLGEIEDAKAELTEIKKNSAKISSEPIWRELIANLEYEIKVKK